jgi:2-methylcitrate dehydratase
VVADFAHGLDWADVPREVTDQVRLRLMDTMGALLAGVDAKPCKIVRSYVRKLQPEGPCSILGTAGRTSVDRAALANGTAARYAELNDTWHRPGRPGVHASDSVAPLVALAEYAGASGTELLAGILVAYEVALYLAETYDIREIDNTNLVAAGVAAAGARLLGLDRAGVARALSLAVVSGMTLRRGRLGAITMWKAVASGEAARRGVVSALLAAEGMDAPVDPFSGPGGLLEVRHDPRPDDVVPPPGVTFRLPETLVKPRAACGTAIPAVLAAEAARGALPDGTAWVRVVVQTYADAVAKVGSLPEHWDPRTRESADHSIPYVVAAVLQDGVLGLAQFDDAHLGSADLRRTIAVTEVIESPAFTADYAAPRHLHRTRVTLHLDDGSTVSGETGGEFGEMGDQSGERIEEKLLLLAGDALGRDRAGVLLEALRHVESWPDCAELGALMCR